ncbi:MAG: fluoride efflux transporter CrcB [Gammaproteobacteria bacterium]|jgi:CrcB protein|nr:fluoride efflux transporter CrcB [Gammaproteobacteria bacterium]MCH2345070.1 fluoride efflux transporter CrcB [Pseudomonadales bacterium]MEE2608757.1 fluoride efflux transporter CrcB [Pseudomonadota bacterium]MCS5581440.1 fluoride efflux transporter CrcB [Gammaproteobacteria bacterium]MEE3172172.1 fluoride efflux transporter CrcB [Pseudomonadota bacterium]|tara:strand:- start:1448 stop:1825 length:378 start_codon:yes stop_codon:yes gene_type:complete
MYTYLAIAFGGALGAVSRYWLTVSIERFNGTGFPLGTFMVNLLGSFLIGLLYILFAEKLSVADQWRPVIITGFLGAMTTFSTFSLDALLLFQQGHYNTALFYVLSSVMICIFAAYVGMQIARILL